MRRREFITLLGGAATGWPHVARAQQPGKIPTVAYLWHAGSEKEESPYYGAVIDGFTKLGYVDGQNISLIHRFPDEATEFSVGTSEPIQVALSAQSTSCQPRPKMCS